MTEKNIQQKALKVAFVLIAIIVSVSFVAWIYSQ
jgi:hypothetical protein